MVVDSVSESDFASVSEKEVEMEDAGFRFSEVSSSRDDCVLDLGLGLSIGGVRSRVPCRISRCNDFTSSSVSSSASSSSSLLRRSNAGFSGTDRAADSAADVNFFNSQVVGWPPVRAYRMNSLSKLATLPDFEMNSAVCNGGNKDSVMENSYSGCGKKPKEMECLKSGSFVKVNMDGIPIGRKIDLHAHTCYQSLAQTLEDMFCSPPNFAINETREDGAISKSTRTLKLLDGSSEFVLTYEDKDGDWMLAGDVPWGMFHRSVRRLRIMKRSKSIQQRTGIP